MRSAGDDGGRRVRQRERQPQAGGQVAGHAGDRHGVGPVRVDLEVVEDVGLDAQGLGEGRAGRQVRREDADPAWSSPSPSSRAEHSIPFDQTPPILRRPISMPFGITVPMVASGTRSPACHVEGPAADLAAARRRRRRRSTRWILLAPWIGRVSSTRATTMPSSPSPIRSSSSTAMPRSLISSPSATGSPSNGAKSRNQESRTFIGGST